MNGVFKHQIWHFLAILILLFIVGHLLARFPDISQGSLWGISTVDWFWLAVSVPILHQLYVWFVWRFELYHHTFSSLWGMKKAFALYSVGFAVLFFSRLVTVTLLGFSNPGSLVVDPMVIYPLAGVVALLSGYLIYSVERYFTYARAVGIDHFDKSFNKPFVKQGIFRYTDNGMYIYGLMILYLPGLLLMSKAALLVAFINHAYIWVHYFCTERPDMVKIYGAVPGNESSQ